MPVDQLITIFSQHTVYLQRVGASLGNDVIPYLEKIETETNAVFAKYRGKGLTPLRAKKIQDEINEITRSNLQAYIKDLRKSNRAVGENEAEFATKTLNGIVKNDDFNSVTPSAAQVNALAVATPLKLSENSFVTYNNMMSQYWQKWTRETDAIVQQGFVEGGTIQEIQKRVMDSFQLEGKNSKTVLSRARRSARQVAITGTNHYANQARIAFVDQNDEVLDGYRFLAVLDSRTSQQCRSLDQTVIPADSPKLSRLTPPLHPNCRSALVYEVKDEYSTTDKDTDRASNFEVDGKSDPKPVSSTRTYYENMKKLSAADQDVILGPTLGKAFRKLNDPEAFAKLTIDSLGNPLTITEMKERDNQLSRILNNG